MLFPTITFAVFFLLVWPVHWLVAGSPRARQVVLLVASWVFYAWWDERFVALLAGSILLAHLGARAVAATAGRPAVQRLVLAAGVTAHLLVLGWFKYYGFFATSLTSALADVGIELRPPLVEVVLPVGISFFTFQAISYLIEVRREAIDPAPLLEVATWMSLFLTITSGPITRASELVPQLSVTPERRLELNRAVWLILRGLFKKVVLASLFASELVDEVFADPDAHSAPEVLLAVYGYAAQLYCDFSGYTDMALGLALLLGLRLPENFRAPYTARTVTEFWTRWHITLSRWLRDFVFTPLARHSAPTTVATCRNLVVVMLLAGLWHGAAWTFVAFGAVHGLAMAAERAARQWRRHHGEALVNTRTRRIARRVRTFHVVCLGWVLFRAESLGDAGALLGRLATGWSLGLPEVSVAALLALVAVVAVQQIPAHLLDSGEAVLEDLPLPLVALGIAVGLTAVDVLGPEGVAPFIYFGF